jgi:deoxyribodipyrimidine photo-lyase
MVTASFLIKHLQIDWRQGQAWFWDTLVDADLASNAASWQWVAGSGADGAPYFRIFNPISQAQKFDPEGRFIRKQLPALQEVATPSIFEAGAQGRAPGYPAAIIDHGFARQRALDGYAQVKAAKS